MRYLKEPEADPFESYNVPQEVEETVEKIIQNVKEEGDEAVLNFTERFDEVSRDQNLLSDDEQSKILSQVSEEIKDLIDNNISNIREFAEEQLRHISGFETEIQEGVTLGQRVVPIETIGAYVPGGEYPLLSSALMSVVPASVAGVDEIIVATPPQEDGLPHPAVVYGALEAGADKICVIGGAQAISALAFGTETIPNVDKIVGPGNIFVTEAKKQLYGQIGVDMLAGPSEILVLADRTADAELIAADLLAQAEHDKAARPLLVTTDEQLGNQVINEVHDQLDELSTAEIASESWRVKGTVVHTEDLQEAKRITNELAPEHLEVQTEDPRGLLDDLQNYGTLFLGENSANVYSDKLIGTNHILPTQRAARYTAGLSVYMFIKLPTHQEVTDAGVETLAPPATKQSRIERLEGHAKSAYMRQEGRDLRSYEMQKKPHNQ